jgi:hypothetical protein
VDVLVEAQTELFDLNLGVLQDKVNDHLAKVLIHMSGAHRVPLRHQGGTLLQTYRFRVELEAWVSTLEVVVLLFEF